MATTYTVMACVMALFFVITAAALLPRLRLPGVGLNNEIAFRVGATMLFVGGAMSRLESGLHAIEDPSSIDWRQLFSFAIQIVGIGVVLVAGRKITEITFAGADPQIDAIRHAAMRDPLTGVFNRRYLTMQLAAELSILDRNRHVAVLQVDVDDFKQINDTAGHLVGDRVLVSITHAIEGALRGADLLARTGGDEFVVVLPGLDGPGAEIVAERILLAVSGMSIEKAPQVTLSIGCSIAPQDGMTPTLLVAGADEAMYAAKRDGGNKVLMLQDLSLLDSRHHRPVGSNLAAPSSHAEQGHDDLLGGR